MNRRTRVSLLLVPALLVGLVPAAGARADDRLTQPMRVETADGSSVPPRVRVGNVRLVEGDDGVTKAVFEVTVSRPTRASVRFRTVDETAVAGLDYSAASGTLHFTAKGTMRRLVVEVLGDRVDEPDETFTLRLSRPSGAAIARGTGRATIVDDDGGGALVSVSDATVSEAQSSTSGAAFNVTLSDALADPVTVDYATADGSATAPADYQTVSGTLTFDPGQTVRQIVVPVVGDTVIEISETFALNLTNATGAAISDGVGMGTITDDDVPSISVANATVTEGNVGIVNAVFNVTLSVVSQNIVTVDYATANGSAAEPVDYQAVSGTLTFGPGQTVRQIVVPVAGDTVIEISETFALNLTNPVNATFTDPIALGTITDDDTVSISVANATVTEGNGAIVNAVFNVTLSAVNGNTITVDYATADGSATAPADYQAVSGTLTFGPGQTIQQVVVPVVGDTAIEISETFALNLSHPVNATFADASAQGTITDNDTVSISIANVTVTEGNVGTVNAVFNVTLSAVSGSTVTVDYATANGSATAGTDYYATSGTLTFAPGEISKQIVVSILGDTTPELNETYSVNLSNPVNATIAGAGYGLGTITNND